MADFPTIAVPGRLTITSVRGRLRRTFCNGAGLARIEIEVAMRTLLERITPVRIARWEQRPSKRLWGPSRVDLEYTTRPG